MSTRELLRPGKPDTLRVLLLEDRSPVFYGNQYPELSLHLLLAPVKLSNAFHNSGLPFSSSSDMSLEAQRPPHCTTNIFILFPRVWELTDAITTPHPCIPCLLLSVFLLSSFSSHGYPCCSNKNLGHTLLSSTGQK